jgi:hypothetical protein
VQVAAQRNSLVADRGAFLSHVDAVREELTAVYAQLRDREATAAAAHQRSAAALAEAEKQAAEIAAERCALRARAGTSSSAGVPILLHGAVHSALADRH